MSKEMASETHEQKKREREGRERTAIEEAERRTGE